LALPEAARRGIANEQKSLLRGVLGIRDRARRHRGILRYRKRKKKKLRRAGRWRGGAEVEKVFSKMFKNLGVKGTRRKGVILKGGGGWSPRRNGEFSVAEAVSPCAEKKNAGAQGTQIGRREGEGKGAAEGDLSNASRKNDLAHLEGKSTKKVAGSARGLVRGGKGKKTDRRVGKRVNRLEGRAKKKTERSIWCEGEEKKASFRQGKKRGKIAGKQGQS